MNVFGRDHRLGRARSRPTTTPAPTLANVNALQINDSPVPAEHARGRLAAKSRGQSHSTTFSEAVDGATDAERTTTEHVRVHHRCTDVRVAEKLLHHPRMLNNTIAERRDWRTSRQAAIAEHDASSRQA
jgi:hypothetical protein